MADPAWLTLCSIHDLPDRAARGFNPFGEGRDALFIVRQGDTLRAYRNICPHQGASLPWRQHAYLNSDGTRIVCSAHGAQFDLQNGQCLQGAALGMSLTGIDLRITDSGDVEVKLDRVL
jgi:nitrite reductase/ring-hydroxylating ferredoxin subunit